MKRKRITKTKDRSRNGGSGAKKQDRRRRQQELSEEIEENSEDDDNNDDDDNDNGKKRNSHSDSDSEGSSDDDDEGNKNPKNTRTGNGDRVHSEGGEDNAEGLQEVPEEIQDVSAGVSSDVLDIVLPSVGGSTNVASVMTTSSSSMNSYVDEMKRKGIIWTDSDYENKINAFCRKCLFSKVKFIVDSKQLDFYKNEERKEYGKIAQYVMTELNLDIEHGKQFWEKFKNTVRFSINRKRANVSIQMKKAFFSKCLFHSLEY